MDRWSSRVLLLLTVCLGSAFTGCVGKSGPTSNNGTVQTVSLNPSATLSIDLGATQGFSATAQNSLGQTVATGFQFFSSNTASLNIAANGAACAGSWDPTGTICTPGVPGVAQVTAVASGVSSPPTTVYVHQHIGSITVARIGNPNPDNGCFSQDQTWDYQATAYSTGGTDITTTVGPMDWAPTPANVATVNSNVVGLQPNQVQVTAKDPGQTQLFATVSGVSSTPINLHDLPGRFHHAADPGQHGKFGQRQCGRFHCGSSYRSGHGGQHREDPTSHLEHNEPGNCYGQQWNGLGASESGRGRHHCFLYSTHLQYRSPARTTDLCKQRNAAQRTTRLGRDCGQRDCQQNSDLHRVGGHHRLRHRPNCTSTMFSVISGANPIAAAATVPFTPNSLMFTPQGTRAYLGSPMGLMFLDLGGSSPTVSTVSSATTPCKVAVCGQVLAISPDGNRVVVADAATQPNQVYIYDNTQPTNAPVDLLISGAIAAAFSPDEMKLFILTNTGTMYVYSKVDALASFSGLGSATDVAFSADGSFAYVAGTPGALSVSGFATCDSANVFNDVTLHATPLAIRPLPNQQLDAKGNWAQPVVAFDPPYVEKFGVKVIQPLLPLNQFTCNGTSAAPDTDFPQTFYNLGLGSFTPLLMQVAGNGTQVIVVAQNVPAVLVLDMTGGTTTAFPLANNPALLAASASPDGSQVFVAACDGVHPDHPDTCNSVHIVNLLAGGDIQEVVFTNINTNDSMCNNLPGSPCLPNLIAVKPQ